MLMKKNINKMLIFFLLLLIISLLLLNNKSKIKEPISEKIELFNWWEENDYKAKDIFNNLFEDIDIDKVKIYSVFGEPSVSKNKSEITVQYSGESNFNDPNLFDINFIPTDKKGQNIVIFPQGTRTPIGANAKDYPYQSGITALYLSCDVKVVPATLNSGNFWPKTGFKKNSGTIILQFLDPIETGLSKQEFILELEEKIESAKI